MGMGGLTNELILDTYVHQTEGSQIGDHRLNQCIIWGSSSGLVTIVVMNLFNITETTRANNFKTYYHRIALVSFDISPELTHRLLSVGNEWHKNVILGWLYSGRNFSITTQPIRKMFTAFERVIQVLHRFSIRLLTFCCLTPEITSSFSHKFTSI